MFPFAHFFYGFWWIFPGIMLVMMVFCFFMMRSHKGGMMCGPGSCCKGSHGENVKKKP